MAHPHRGLAPKPASGCDVFHIWQDRFDKTDAALTWLFGTYHSAFAIAIYIAICAVITLVATAMKSDFTGKGIAADYQSR